MVKQEKSIIIIFKRHSHTQTHTRILFIPNAIMKKWMKRKIYLLTPSLKHFVFSVKFRVFNLIRIDFLVFVLSLFGYFVNYTNYVIEVEKRAKLMLESKSQKQQVLCLIFNLEEEILKNLRKQKSNSLAEHSPVDLKFA